MPHQLFHLGNVVVLNEMSKELGDMSKAMRTGKVSQDQMQTMHDRLAQMKMTLDSMRQR